MNIDTPDGTTDDLEKDLPAASPNQQYRGQEGESHSTAAEGTLKSPDQLPDIEKEQDKDDVVHAEDSPETKESGHETSLNKEEKLTPDDISG